MRNVNTELSYRREIAQRSVLLRTASDEKMKQAYPRAKKELS